MFKCLQFIDEKLRQLNEADEMPTDDDMSMEEGGDDMGGGEQGGKEEAPAPEEGGDVGGEEANDPSQIAEVDNGTFVSDLGKAEIAKSLLKALTLAKPNDSIPVEFQTVTTQNANDIIQYVKTMLQIDNDEFGNELNNI